MAKKVITTSAGVTELDAPKSDRNALQDTNVLYEEALKADWALHASRLSQ